MEMFRNDFVMSFTCHSFVQFIMSFRSMEMFRNDFEMSFTCHSFVQFLISFRPIEMFGNDFEMTFTCHSSSIFISIISHVDLYCFLPLNCYHYHCKPPLLDFILFYEITLNVSSKFVNTNNSKQGNLGLLVFIL